MGRAVCKELNLGRCLMRGEPLGIKMLQFISICCCSGCRSMKSVLTLYEHILLGHSMSACLSNWASKGLQFEKASSLVQLQ